MKELEDESQRRDVPSFQGDDTIQTIPEMMEKTGDETSQNITTSQDIRSTLDLKHDLAAANINSSRLEMADNRDGTARFNGQTPTSVLSQFISYQDQSECSSSIPEFGMLNSIGGPRKSQQIRNLNKDNQKMKN